MMPILTVSCALAAPPNIANAKTASPMSILSIVPSQASRVSERIPNPILIQVRRECNRCWRRRRRGGGTWPAAAPCMGRSGMVQNTGGSSGSAMDRQPKSAGTIDADEIARFSRIAGQWWDPRGPMAALHKFNPVRLVYIRDRMAAHFGRDPKRLDSLTGLRVLDIGCGGGILSEPLARLGASVVGADPSDRNIAVARQHAAQSGLAV